MEAFVSDVTSLECFKTWYAQSKGKKEIVIKPGDHKQTMALCIIADKFPRREVSQKLGH